MVMVHYGIGNADHPAKPEMVFDRLKSHKLEGTGCHAARDSFRSCAVISSLSSAISSLRRIERSGCSAINARKCAIL
jgi:hypothetical protein